MSSPTRIYKVADREAGLAKLVRATTKAQALRAATQEMFSVEVASQDDLVDLIGNGAPVIDASAIDAATTDKEPTDE